MRYLPNIERSAFGKWYVGYGGGLTFKITRHAGGGWQAAPRLARPEDWPLATHWPRARTLEALSDKLAGLPPMMASLGEAR